LEVGDEHVHDSVLDEEARGHRLLLVFVRRSPKFRCKINPHQEVTASVVWPDSDPKMALLQSSGTLLALEAALDKRRIAVANARDAATKVFSRYSLLFALPIYTFLLSPPCGPGIRSLCLHFF
jgi:hypothetical protein